MTSFKFLKVLKEHDLKPIKDNFKNPFKNKYIRERGDWRFNLCGAYYFSKAIGETSMWMNYRRWVRDNDPYSKKNILICLAHYAPGIKRYKRLCLNEIFNIILLLSFFFF